MSDLLRQACVEARKQNSTIKQQVRDIGSTFLNNVEISAQEAVYIILQLPMRKASRQIVFINTSPKDERVEVLKPVSYINELDDDSEDIFASGLIKRYAKRPASLENLTLADWAAWYDSSGSYVRQSNELDTDNLSLETAADDVNDDDIEASSYCVSNKLVFSEKNCLFTLTYTCSIKVHYFMPDSYFIKLPVPLTKLQSYSEVLSLKT